jgi:N-terminal domain of (some) glycogen debranching enzymes
LSFQPHRRSRTEATLLKHDNAFGVFDTKGDALSSPGGTQGVYYCDTRYLSHFLITVKRQAPNRAELDAARG